MTHTAFAGVLVNPWNFAASGSPGSFPAVTLASGQTDVEPWADNQEVVIDRIVGNIGVSGVSYGQFTTLPSVLYAPAVVCRLGILVQEEADATSAPAIDLFNDEQCEDYEWMWLRHFMPGSWNYIPNTNPSEVPTAAVGFYETLDLDLRVKRKLGQTDQLLLYAQYGTENMPELESNPTTFVSGNHLLRSIFLSK